MYEPDEVNQQARIIYNEWSDSQPSIHYRVPAWEELTERARDAWRHDAELIGILRKIQ